MNIESRQIGAHGGYPAKCIEVTVTDWSGNSSIIEDVTNLDGKVDESLIFQLRELANELEEQNEKLNKL